VILLESGKGGITFIPQDKMGTRMVSTGELRLINVSVPVHHLIGKEVEGLSILDSLLSVSNVEISAQGLENQRRFHNEKNN